MKVYAVFREGVYRHQCGGIFTSLEIAKHVARACCERDYDGYHTYDVVPFDLDEPVAQACPPHRWDYLREAKRLFVATRDDFKHWGGTDTAGFKMIEGVE